MGIYRSLAQVYHFVRNAAGSTDVGFGTTDFHVQFRERIEEGSSETSHRALRINPLYAEGQFSEVR